MEESVDITTRTRRRAEDFAMEDVSSYTEKEKKNKKKKKLKKKSKKKKVKNVQEKCDLAQETTTTITTTANNNNNNNCDGQDVLGDEGGARNHDGGPGCDKEQDILKGIVPIHLHSSSNNSNNYF